MRDEDHFLKMLDEMVIQQQNKLLKLARDRIPHLTRITPMNE